MTCICCSQGLHRGCQRWGCNCPCQKRDWWDQFSYQVWRVWDRLCQKALQAWEIPVNVPDPLVPENPASVPPSVPAAAEPPVAVEDDAASTPGGGREADVIMLEYWRAKVEAFDSRHPSLLGPL